MASANSKFRFKKLDCVGAAAAEDDQKFLQSCFIDTGDLEALFDCDDARRIVVGRTGAGKSALLLKLAKNEQKTIEVRPESLALAYISNSNILQFFSELGVKLDIFFRLLWRHVFTVEILKQHFHITDEAAKRSFLSKILDLFKDDKHRKAIEYLQKWGQSFWQETEYRIKEVTTTLERDLKATIEGKIDDTSISLEGAKKLTAEQKSELVQRAQTVVNNVQIRQLSEILDLVKDVLARDNRYYYIVIDRLDEDWIEEKLRFRLIRALIETVKDFVKIRHVKIVVAIRLDLLERVFRITRDAGFQEEKYESLYLPLTWGRDALVHVLDERINHLIKSRYTSRRLTHTDILPRQIDGQASLDYLLERTMFRPRDVIMFVNYCIQKATGKEQFTVQNIREAEGEYSRDRLKSLADEWFSDYPNLLEFTKILSSRSRRFILTDISDKQCEDFALEQVIAGCQHSDDLFRSAAQLVDLQIQAAEFRKVLIYSFYRTGLVGLKAGKSEAFLWTTVGRRSLTRTEIPDDCCAQVHPMFWRVLHIGFERVA
jgi:hypothetical protein